MIIIHSCIAYKIRIITVNKENRPFNTADEIQIAYNMPVATLLKITFPICGLINLSITLFKAIQIRLVTRT